MNVQVRNGNQRTSKWRKMAACTTLIMGLLTTSVFGFSTQVSAATLPTSSTMYDSFEGFLGSYWYREMANNIYSGTVSSKYAKYGTRSYRIQLKKSDPLVNNSKRSEITIKRAEGALEKHTYTFSMLLPSGGIEDYGYDPEGSEVVAQWHNTPDVGEAWTYPPLALRTWKGHWYLDRHWDDAAMSTNKSIDSKGYRDLIDLGEYTKGKWVTWKFHVKWGWSSTQNPILQVYKDGIKVLDRSGKPNTMNDKVGVHMKLGIYKWDWAQVNTTSILTNRVIYYDAVGIQ